MQIYDRHHHYDGYHHASDIRSKTNYSFAAGEGNPKPGELLVPFCIIGGHPFVFCVVDTMLILLLVIQPGHSSPVKGDEMDDIAEKESPEASHHQTDVP